MHLHRSTTVFLILLGIVQVQSDASTVLNNVKLSIEAGRTAKNVWEFAKDLPPTLTDYLTRLVSGKNMDESQTPPSSYDFVVDLTRPTDIFGKLKSYPLIYPSGKEVYDKKIQDEQRGISRFVVNVVGRYNVGKTFILRLLANINVAHSFTERTNGLSVALPLLSDTDNTPIALIDTAGTRTPVEYSDVSFKDRSYERQVSDSFIQEVAISSAGIFVCVVNQLTLDDQLYLKTLYNRLIENGLTPTDIQQRLLLVHNYFHLNTIAEVDAVEKHELEKLFGARKQPQGFWLSDQFKHFVIANDGSEAGTKYNDRSIEQIRTMIRGANAAKHSDVLSTIIAQIEKLLSNVLVEEGPVTTDDGVRGSQQGIFGRVASGIIAMLSSNRKKPVQVLPQYRVHVQLEVQQLNIDKGETLWFICPKSALAENVTLSKHLTFAEDGSVHVDYSSHFIPGVKVFRFEDGDIQIQVECPSCENSYTVTTHGGSVIIRGEKTMNTQKDSEVYVDTHRVGKFEVQVPITTMEKNYVYDIRKKSITNFYQNGVIILTVKRLKDDDHDDL